MSWAEAEVGRQCLEVQHVRDLVLASYVEMKEEGRGSVGEAAPRTDVSRPEMVAALQTSFSVACPLPQGFWAALVVEEDQDSQDLNSRAVFPEVAVLLYEQIFQHQLKEGALGTLDVVGMESVRELKVVSLVAQASIVLVVYLHGSFETAEELAEDLSSMQSYSLCDRDWGVLFWEE